MKKKVDLTEKLTDELVYIREQARLNKDYKLSDEIRNELDSRGSFVFDTKYGQVVYHIGSGYKRDELNKSDLDRIFNK